jgi:hypothetical protein
MGASRESYKISSRWKWGGKTYSEKIKSVYRLLKRVIIDRRDGDLFIMDNISQPFDKMIGCKLFGHDFMHDYEDPEYFCKKCWKRISEQQHDSQIRRKKLQKIRNKI